LFALALLNAAELLGEDAYRRRAEDLTTSIVDEQSPEGWYREYEGADPGYESLGIFHLAVYWRRTRSDRVLTSLARSVEFYGHFVHPDGSVGGVYGSRQTGLYVPAGFEILSHHVPGAAAVARFMRDRLPNGSVPTPSSIDLHNLPMLTYAYAEAALAVRPQATAPAPEPLPCEALDGVKHFPHAGLAVAAAREYYAVTSISRGGVLNVFDRTHGRLLHQDAGYGARVGRRRWSSQISGFGHALESTDPATISVRTTFGDAGQQLPTPATFLLLRILNLTAFRSLTLGSWLRKHIVRRLVLPKRPGPLTLTRRIAFGEAAVTVTDLLEAKTGTRVDAVGLLRTFTAGHMGSARYFHPSELTPGAGPDTSHLAAELTRNGTARVEHSIDCRRTRSIEGMDRAAGSLLEMARR
jgi:hypothetical protein